MKIAVIFPGGIFSAWGVSDGIPRTFRAMGHEVLDFPRARYGQPELSLEALNSCNLIVLSGLEHLLVNEIFGFLDEITQYEWWNEIKVPRAAWYHESAFREDWSFGTNFDAFRRMADVHFFPAIQDAEFFDADDKAKGHSHWLPFGADTEVFKPADTKQDVDVGFVGTLYPKRQEYLRKLQPHCRSWGLLCGGVQVRDITGTDPEATVLRLAENYRRIKVNINLPHLSRLVVTKVYEIMGCQGFLLTPWLGESEASPNMQQFEHMKHFCYYKVDEYRELSRAVEHYLAYPEDRAAIAEAGMKEVHAKHRQDQRLAEMLEKMGLKEALQ